MQKYLVLILLACTLGLCLLLPREQEQQMTFEVFNTLCTVRIWHGGNTETAMREVAKTLQALHASMNLYDSNSEIARLNTRAANGPVVCSPLLWNCLLKARQAYELTDGAFDITVGPLMKLWGFHGKANTLPTDEEIRQRLNTVGFKYISFDDEKRTVRFTRPGIVLDLGGIAKGYACQCIADILKRHKISVYLLDFGGNLAVSEKTPRGKRFFNIGLRDPNSPANLVCTRQLKGVTVATSGNYERSRVIDGKRVGHIMDPKTGRPGYCFKSVTAICPDATLADAFSTAVFIGGQSLATKLTKDIPGTSFIIVDDKDQLSTIGE